MANKILSFGCGEKMINHIAAIDDQNLINDRPSREISGPKELESFSNQSWGKFRLLIP